jgi:hypothetical protein
LHAAEDEQGYAAAAVGSADSGSATDAGARGDRGADGCDWISAAPGSRGRRLDRSPQRAWATPLEVLLVAERAALLAGRDDEFTMLVTIGYTGMRWGETIGLERDLLLPALINVEWQLREIGGRFHRLPPKDDSYRSTRYEPLVPVDLPAFFAELLTAQAGKRAQGSDAPAPPSTAGSPAKRFTVTATRRGAGIAERCRGRPGQRGHQRMR